MDEKHNVLFHFDGQQILQLLNNKANNDSIVIVKFSVETDLMTIELVGIYTII